MSMSLMWTIRTKLAEGVPQATIARELHVSSSYINRVHKKCTYLRRGAAIQVAYAWGVGDLGVVELAQKFGYSDRKSVV